MAVDATATAGAPVAHHFDNLRQQQATVRFGMWLFLVTEVLFFGGALCAYTAYRIWFPKEFEAGSAALNVGIASVNTILLLTSSLTITLGIRACYVGDQRGLRTWLLATLVLGTAFLVLKLREYQLDYEDGLVPGGRTTNRELEVGYSAQPLPGMSMTDRGGSPTTRRFEDNLAEVLEREKKHTGFDYEKAGVYLPRVQLFFMFYYALTGLHVLHMVVGIGLLIWQYVLASRGFFAYAERYVYVEVMSLYWHFVDMVWMFLLPLLYLAGPHSWGQAVEQFMLAIGLGH